MRLRIAVELAVHVVVGGLHGGSPVGDAHVAVQWRQAVGVAVEHIELVRQFVDHQVVGVPATAALHAGPGKDHRALQGGFAGALVVEFVHDASGVAVFLRADEVVGVEHQLMEAAVPVQVRQVQQRQLGLGGEQQAAVVVQFDAGQRREALVAQEQQRPLAEPAQFLFAQAVEDRQLPPHLLPELGVERIAGEEAPAAPGAERPHGRISARLVGPWPMGASCGG